LKKRLGDLPESFVVFVETFVASVVKFGFINHGGHEGFHEDHKGLPGMKVEGG
jgi:hypothetical protein